MVIKKMFKYVNTTVNNQNPPLHFTLLFGLHAFTFYTLPSAHINFATDLFDKQIKFIEVN